MYVRNGSWVLSMRRKRKCVFSTFLQMASRDDCYQSSVHGYSPSFFSITNEMSQKCVCPFFVSPIEYSGMENRREEHDLQCFVGINLQTHVCQYRVSLRKQCVPYRIALHASYMKLQCENLLEGEKSFLGNSFETTLIAVGNIHKANQPTNQTYKCKCIYTRFNGK